MDIGKYIFFNLHVLVSSSRSLYLLLRHNGRERKKKKYLCGAGSPVLKGSLASHRRGWSSVLELNQSRLWKLMWAECLHACQLTHSHADLPLVLLTVDLWNEDQWYRDLILCLRVLPLHYHYACPMSCDLRVPETGVWLIFRNPNIFPLEFSFHDHLMQKFHQL